MKRFSNLYEKIISIENLKLADSKARLGKENSYGVKIHDKNKEANIQKLHENLLMKTYKTSEYKVFTVFEPKEREIFRLPYYPDRIVHHAIMNILEPIWTKTFTYNTYSCIKRRGIEGCARQIDKILKSFSRSEKLYCLKIDIKKFYPSINHDVLKKIIRHKIKDKDLLWLLDEIIDSAKGLPIGNYLSQYLANLVFSPFMHWVNEKLPYIIQERLGLKDKPKIYSTEYADDIVFIAETKEILHLVLNLIRPEIEDNLRLTIKQNYQIFPISDNKQSKHGRALDYVGYQFFRKQKLIRKNIKKNFCKTISKLNKRRNITPKEYKQKISPWLGWAKHSNSKHLLKKTIRKDYYESIL